MEAMARWLKQSWLKLNPSKMRVLWQGGNTGLRCQFPTLDGVSLTPASTIKSLDVTLDASISVKAQITNVARLSLNLQVWQLATYLLHTDLATMIYATFTSR